MKGLFCTGVFLFCVSVIVPQSSFSAEGMYPLDGTDAWPHQEMKKNGLKISAQKLLKLRGAIAKVASGGTGSFVSGQGLLVTNHHVAVRCIAALNGMERHKGILEDGYIASSHQEEIPCPGYDLLVVDDVIDITARIAEKVSDKLRGHKRFEALRLAREELETACEKKGTICEAAALDGGRFQHMMVYRRIRDVRLVYNPERDIGKYGGDVDNWMYPRHTGDYTFLRAYVSRSGEGSPYSPANVPFGPATYLKVSAQGVNKGDFVLVLGFPASTKRNLPAASARFYSETATTVRKQVYGEMIDVIQSAGKKDDKTKRRYISLDARLNNATKYYTQSLEGFKKWDIVGKRMKQESQVKNNLSSTPEQAALFEKLLKRIDRAYNKYSKDFRKHFYLTRIPKLVRSVGTAYDITRWTEERKKSDKEREDAEYKTKNVFKVFEASDMLDDQITHRGEKALLTYLLKERGKLSPKKPSRSVQKLIRWGKKELAALKKAAQKAGTDLDVYYAKMTGESITDDPIALAVHLAYAKTSLLAHSEDRDERERAFYQRRRLFFNSAKTAKRFQDPLLNFGRDLYKEIDKMEKGSYRGIEETFETELRSQYAELIGAKYPDANFQVRLTHGIVDDYTATADGKKYRYITTLAGAVAKDKGSFPFRVPPSLKQHAAQTVTHRFADKNIGDIPINFTTTLDTTGGNSGSPVVDGRGRLVGLLFDGTPESILSDWQFLPDDQRSICLDIRYTLFLANTVHNAQHLLKEMGL